MKTVSVRLSERGVDDAIAELERYKQWVANKAKELTERLALIGIKEASVRFNGAYYDSDRGNDTKLSVEPSGNGYKIVASGTQVCFVEFGAGVYYNGSEPYPSPPGRPGNVSGIGEYGTGHGKQDSWGYYGEDGKLHITHGTPAAMPMYHSAREIERELLSVAKEVFGK